ncbi:MAG: efflux RND transporter permease subunit [Myxococcales bacterium]|nr:efflux RND transporter permease subunit [Myxococcales bacterium]
MSEPTTRTASGLMRRARRGPMAWMARNPVAANLLMFMAIAGGLVVSRNIKQEVFPEFDPDAVTVSVIYPGASPAEVEQGIILAVEEAVRGIDGVKRVISTARENTATVQVELLTGADLDAVQADVKAAVDQLRSLPEEAERPIVSAAPNKRQVIAAIIYGDEPHETLRQIAENVRNGLLADTPVTQTEMAGVPPREVAIEIDQEALRRYGLTLDRVAQIVRAASIELPGGALRTRGGEVLVRTTERRDVAAEFAEITVLARPDGTRVGLGEIATIRDTFAETDQEATFNGKPAVRLDIYRVGDQTPIQIAKAVRDYLDQLDLPPGIGVAPWDDQSVIYQGRVELLIKNAMMGLVLVLVVLGLFLEIRLAFWVMVGIPISFLGAFLVMPWFDVSVNLISMFAFLLVLGIVVDDAIVVGENVFEYRRQGMTFAEAAIIGSKEVATPIVFAVLTTVATFGPLLFVPGFTGKIFGVIPIIVISVLIWSLLESLFVLPAHLAHLKERVTRGPIAFIDRYQEKFSRAFDRFIENRYVPFARFLARNRWAVGAWAIASLMLAIGLGRGGFVRFDFFPKIEGELITASVRLPIGASVEDTRLIAKRLVAASDRMIAQNGGEKIRIGTYAQIGQALRSFRPGAAPSVRNHITEVQIQVVPIDQRALTARQLADAWRAEIGTLVGIETQNFTFELGASPGAAIDIQLSHPDTPTLEHAAERVARAITDFEGVRDVDPGFSNGKEQLDATLNPLGRSLGLTETDLARQLRAGYFGSEALRQQRGRDEVRVMVRLPVAQRATRQSLEQLILRTPSGGEVPLGQAATLTPGRADTAIRRVDGRRVLNVTADVDTHIANANELLARIGREVLPPILGETQGLAYSLEGSQREQRESLGKLAQNFVLAMLVVYGLLAVPFRSYAQPILVMSVIPFGFVGAVLGHLFMGYDLSVISVLGIVALAGVVVNDSLILVVATNELREKLGDPTEAVILGTARRFRPILLTSLTTFFGLMPMIFETSVQARFLIPMAISLGFGVLTSTIIVLVVVPSFYLMLEDVKRAIAWLGGPLRRLLAERPSADSGEVPQ